MIIVLDFIVIDCIIVTVSDVEIVEGRFNLRSGVLREAHLKFWCATTTSGCAATRWLLSLAHCIQYMVVHYMV